LAHWIGSAPEYYDFFICGTGGALVFNKIFFPTSHPATGLLLARATFGVGCLRAYDQIGIPASDKKQQAEART
jgi:hypothetical protein